MDFATSSIDAICEHAFNTRCPKEMRQLSKHPSMNVRRALARNKHTSKEVINLLSEDPTMNVSYIALQHPKSDVKRGSNQNVRPCVSCMKDEHRLDCENCVMLVKYTK